MVCRKRRFCNEDDGSHLQFTSFYLTVHNPRLPFIQVHNKNGYSCVYKKCKNLHLVECVDYIRD